MRDFDKKGLRLHQPETVFRAAVTTPLARGRGSQNHDVFYKGSDYAALYRMTSLCCIEH